MNEQVDRLVSRSAPGAPAGERYQFEFKADPREYFRIWIVNLALTIITIGIYSAWAKVRKLRYFYASTSLAGSSFGYHGEPLKILKGRCIAAVLLIAYFIAARISPAAAFVVALIILLLRPWLVVKSRIFALRVTSWRGIRFDFEPDYRGAYGALLRWPILAILTLGILSPRAVRERYLFIVTRSRFGATRFACVPRIVTFYKATFGVLGLSLATLIVMLALIMLGAVGVRALHIASGMTAAAAKRASAIGFAVMLYAILIPIVLGYWHARILSEVYGQTALGPHRLHARLRARRLIGVYLTNLFGMIFTLGMFTPWAQIRLARYYLEALAVDAHGSLDALPRGEASTVPSATGEEVSSLFDVDFGF